MKQGRLLVYLIFSKLLSIRKAYIHSKKMSVFFYDGRFAWFSSRDMLLTSSPFPLVTVWLKRILVLLSIFFAFPLFNIYKFSVFICLEIPSFLFFSSFHASVAISPLQSSNCIILPIIVASVSN